MQARRDTSVGIIRTVRYRIQPLDASYKTGFLWSSQRSPLYHACPMTTSIILIRHGQIDANVDGRWHGSTDSPLNNLGLSQADRMAKHVSERHPEISAVYASPLQRTFNTAAPLAAALGLEVVADPRFREYGVGDLEGTLYSDLREMGFFSSIAQDQGYAPLNGESPRQVRDRMLEGFLQVAEIHSGESIAIVSHGAAMGILLAMLLNEQIFPFHEFHMDNTGFSQLHHDQNSVLKFFNNTAHLQAPKPAL